MQGRLADEKAQQGGHRFNKDYVDSLELQNLTIIDESGLRFPTGLLFIKEGRVGITTNPKDTDQLTSLHSLRKQNNDENYRVSPIALPPFATTPGEYDQPEELYIDKRELVSI